MYINSLYYLCCFSISANKNAVYGDVNAVSPGGLRLGTHSFYKHLNKGDGDNLPQFVGWLFRLQMNFSINFFL
jgi:hypothetical protein